MPVAVAAYDKALSYTETGGMVFRFTPSVARQVLRSAGRPFEAARTAANKIRQRSVII